MISSIFQMTIGHHVEFLKAQNFIYWGVWRVETCHHAKFCRNWSTHYGDIVILPFFKMAATDFLDFGNCKILLANGV